MDSADIDPTTDSPVEMHYLDTNDDATPDAVELSLADGSSMMAADMNDDGSLDTVLVDADGDGTYESAYVDIDGDGTAEVVQHDADGDGNFESLEIAGAELTLDPSGLVVAEPVLDEANSVSDLDLGSSPGAAELTLSVEDMTQTFAAIDVDGDGVIDAAVLATDAAGKPIAVGLDTDGDLVIDTVVADDEGDGVIDRLYVDANGEGTWIEQTPDTAQAGANSPNKI